jgi:AcrR family transcriptional regulator
VPKLWNNTIEAHRREVREAILGATATLVAERGLLAVTMSQIAEQTGIGRATLYKYFPDVEAILVAWHARHVTAHLQHLAEVRAQDGGPGPKLEAVLRAYAHIVQGRTRHGADLSALLHRDDHVAAAQQQVHDLVRDVLAEAATAGHIRDDIAADELACYCLHALAATGDLPDETAVDRLVTLTLAGLQPPLVTGP